MTVVMDLEFPDYEDIIMTKSQTTQTKPIGIDEITQTPQTIGDLLNKIKRGKFKIELVDLGWVWIELKNEIWMIVGTKHGGKVLDMNSFIKP